MTRPRIHNTEAVVLKQTPLGEADRILTLYTPDFGTVRAVARGVRRTKSKFGGHLELLNKVSVSISFGRNLDRVNEAEAVESFSGFKDDLQRLSRGIYIGELVHAFSAEQSPNLAVYELLVDALRWLEETEQPDLLLRHFETQLLDDSGYRPELIRCVECRTELEPGGHLFSRAVGGVLCPRCRAASDDVLIPISLNAMKVLRFLQRERGYGKAESLRVSAPLVRELERLLGTYIRYILERELKSVEFMNLVSSVGERYPSA